MHVYWIGLVKASTYAICLRRVNRTGGNNIRLAARIEICLQRLGLFRRVGVDRSEGVIAVLGGPLRLLRVQGERFELETFL